MFCHRYPTGPCAGGNPGVRSARDTVASVRWMGNRPARGHCDCQPRGSRELGLKDMTNVSEPLLSRRQSNHAKEADRHEPKGMQSGWGARASPHADVALPAERRGLRRFLSKNACAHLSFRPSSTLRRQLHSATMRLLPRLEDERKSCVIARILFRQPPYLPGCWAGPGVLIRL